MPAEPELPEELPPEELELLPPELEELELLPPLDELLPPELEELEPPLDELPPELEELELLLPLEELLPPEEELELLDPEPPQALSPAPAIATLTIHARTDSASGLRAVDAAGKAGCATRGCDAEEYVRGPISRCVENLRLMTCLRGDAIAD